MLVCIFFLSNGGEQLKTFHIMYWQIKNKCKDVQILLMLKISTEKDVLCKDNWSRKLWKWAFETWWPTDKGTLFTFKACYSYILAEILTGITIIKPQGSGNNPTISGR